MKKAENNIGVVLLKNIATEEVMVADTYNNTASRERIFSEFLDMGLRTFQKDKRANADLAVFDYHTGNVDSICGYSDIQIGILMNNLTPERIMHVCQYSFARTEKPDIKSDEVPLEVQRRVAEYQAYYFGLRTGGRRDTRASCRFGKECSHLQRLAVLNGGLSLMGHDKIRTAQDAAFMCRWLARNDVEHVYVLFERRQRRMLMHLGSGRNCLSDADPEGLVRAADGFRAERIWMVGNGCKAGGGHDERNRERWMKLKHVFKKRLQEPILTISGLGGYNCCKKGTEGGTELRKGNQSDQRSSAINEDGAENADRENRKQDLLGVMVVNEACEVVGNILLQSDLKDTVKVVQEVLSKTSFLGRRLVFYTNTGQVPMLRQLFTQLMGDVARGLEVLDIVITCSTERYRSLAQEGMLEPDAVLGQDTDVLQVEVIPIRDGRGIIRVRRNEEYSPAELLRRSEMTRLDKGEITKEQLAAIYFPCE